MKVSKKTILTESEIFDLTVFASDLVFSGLQLLSETLAFGPCSLEVLKSLKLKNKYV